MANPIPCVNTSTIDALVTLADQSDYIDASRLKIDVLEDPFNSAFGPVKLRIDGTTYFFLIQEPAPNMLRAPSKDQFAVTFSPGVELARESHAVFGQEGLGKAFGIWVRLLQRELNTPDLMGLNRRIEDELEIRGEDASSELNQAAAEVLSQQIDSLIERVNQLEHDQAMTGDVALGNADEIDELKSMLKSIKESKNVGLLKLAGEAAVKGFSAKLGVELATELLDLIDRVVKMAYDVNA